MCTKGRRLLEVLSLEFIQKMEPTFRTLLMTFVALPWSSNFSLEWVDLRRSGLHYEVFAGMTGWLCLWASTLLPLTLWRVTGPISQWRRWDPGSLLVPSCLFISSHSQAMLGGSQEALGAAQLLRSRVGVFIFAAIHIRGIKISTLIGLDYIFWGSQLQRQQWASPKLLAELGTEE